MSDKNLIAGRQIIINKKGMQLLTWWMPLCILLKDYHESFALRMPNLRLGSC
jgi:hypothetical protein